MADLLKDIIKNLNDTTISNDIEWKLSSSIFNSDTSKKYETWSVDGKTRFVVEIKMDNKFNLRKDGCLSIHNQDLVDGCKYVFISDYLGVEKLIESVYLKYIKPNLSKKNDNDTYESILSNIFSKQHKRDQRIDTILGESDGKTQNSLEEKPKSIINRLFGN